MANIEFKANFDEVNKFFAKLTAEFKDFNQKVSVGVMTKDLSLQIKAMVQEYGATINVTDKQRKYLAAIGLYLSPNTKTIKIPERSYIRATYSKTNLQDKFIRYLENKITTIDITTISGRRKVLDSIGTFWVEEIKNTIIQMKAPPLNEFTKEVKGNNLLLIDSKELINSISYEYLSKTEKTKYLTEKQYKSYQNKRTKESKYETKKEKKLKITQITQAYKQAGRAQDYKTKIDNLKSMVKGRDFEKKKNIMKDTYNSTKNSIKLFRQHKSESFYKEAINSVKNYKRVANELSFTGKYKNAGSSLKNLMARTITDVSRMNSKRKNMLIRNAENKAARKIQSAEKKAIRKERMTQESKLRQVAFRLRAHSTEQLTTRILTTNLTNSQKTINSLVQYQKDIGTTLRLNSYSKGGLEGNRRYAKYLFNKSAVKRKRNIVKAKNSSNITKMNVKIRQGTKNPNNILNVNLSKFNSIAKKFSDGGDKK